MRKFLSHAGFFQTNWGLSLMHHDCVNGRVSNMGRRPGKAFIEHASQGVYVRSVIDWIPLRLFWTHVCRTAKDASGCCESWFNSRLIIQNLCDAKIDQLKKFPASLRIYDHHVAGFNVSMHNILFMGMRKGAAGLFD